MQAPSLYHHDPQPQRNDTAWEASYRRFSQFQYEEAAGPREAFCKLWELCCQWLKPQMRSVDQILALFVMEKFLQILPADTEASTRMLNEARERLFALIEDLRNVDPENMPPPRPAFPRVLFNLLFHGNQRKLAVRVIAFHFSKEYQYLEPPGEEPPEQLLAEFKVPEETQKSPENQDQWEMPGTSKEAQGSLHPRAPPQARPYVRPFSPEQLGLCSAHQQQYNRRVGSRAGRVAREGPRNRAGPSWGSDRYGSQFISQEEDTHEHAVCSNSFSQAATVSSPQAAYFDEERQQCRLCKREFMYKLGLKEHVRAQVVSRPYLCPYCGKSFRGQSHVIAHQVRHTEERPFVCQYCQKSYKHKSSLLRHLKIHKREDEEKEGQGSLSPMHNTD
ncbi:zinc finger protein 449-like [Cricetulus griseus]|uniref:Zinc finger protein 449-like n=1 Tax=Cricetulus griseus TaxID=10029 RepID=A0A9J7GKG3_CRIGR|nr:zinc finger protein 449-like [Cricetulus griseus]